MSAKLNPSAFWLELTAGSEVGGRESFSLHSVSQTELFCCLGAVQAARKMAATSTNGFEKFFFLMLSP
jgi:hypothetical protein